ncbi:MAG: GNAT family N-acetyltransferase [Actinomycetia bacterium]|nr:GNAT family N-acetyltransferase [Actinomycetes bacterium]
MERFTLSGHHVELAPLAAAHAPALQSAADRDRSTYGHTIVPADLAAMEAYIDGLLHDAERDTVVPFVQLRASDQSPVGCTRFMNVIWWPGRDRPAEVEIGGTWLAADAQRSPINTEAKLLLLTQAFETWRVFRVALCTDAANTRSRDAIERIGASFEGILRRHRPSAGYLGTPGEARDSAMFSITDHEWPAVRDRLRQKLDGSTRA